MIKIKREENVIFNNRFVSIEITGHADYAPHGYDIVCSAVSSLYQTLLLTLEEKNIKGVAKKGNKNKRLVIIRNPSCEIEVLIDSFFIGTSAIADTYPKNVIISAD